MADTAPPWIAVARALVGKVQDGSSILPLAQEVGRLYPDMAAYCRRVTPDMPWCGLFVAFCFAKAGVRPVYDPDVDTRSFLWAQAWRGFGRAVSTPQVGDVLVFPHHVTFYVGEDADRYQCLGGNQSDGVNVTLFRKSSCEAILRAGPAIVLEPTAPIAPGAAPVDFKKVLPELLEHEGGNDDDPRDPGGRTSRGILQSEWDTWRQSHPGLPADVFNAPDAEVEAIFHQKYWDAVLGDELPEGVDYAVFDFAVNSGVVRATRYLQTILGDVDVDGEVGPLTVASANAHDARELVNKICDARLAFLQGLGTWPTFGRGWTKRVADVRATSLALIVQTAPAPKPAQPKDPAMPDTTPVVPAPAPTPAPALPKPPLMDEATKAALKAAALEAVRGIASDPVVRGAFVKGVSALAGGSIMTTMPYLGIALTVLLQILNATGFVGTDAGVATTAVGQSLQAAALGTGGLGATALLARGVHAIASLAARLRQ